MQVLATAACVLIMPIAPIMMEAMGVCVTRDSLGMDTIHVMVSRKINISFTVMVLHNNSSMYIVQQCHCQG